MDMQWTEHADSIDKVEHVYSLLSLARHLGIEFFRPPNFNRPQLLSWDHRASACNGNQNSRQLEQRRRMHLRLVLRMNQNSQIGCNSQKPNVAFTFLRAVWGNLISSTFIKMQRE